MFCPHCGCENSDDAVYCMNCGGAISEDTAPRVTAIDVYANKQSRMVILLLSCLVPGLGQMYLRQYRRGIKLLVIQIFLTASLIVHVFQYGDQLYDKLQFQFLMFLNITMWVYNMMDALHVVDEYNRGIEENNGSPPW